MQSEASPLFTYLSIMSTNPLTDGAIIGRSCPLPRGGVSWGARSAREQALRHVPVGAPCTVHTDVVAVREAARCTVP